jgi:hypothetical protein
MTIVVESGTQRKVHAKTSAMTEVLLIVTH